MAAVLYTRIIAQDGSISTQMICSKTKVAPIKRISIPRLELTAALLLARLIKLNLKALDLPVNFIHCWSDSAVTIAWINSSPSRWKDYVHNRVVAIHDTLPNSSWNFIARKENPADCATRGINADQLLNHNLWWNGPNWLSQPSASWPKSTPNIRLEDNSHLEERPGNISLVATSISYWNLLDRYSSFKKLIQVVSICYRFIYKLRKRPESSPIHYPLTPIELEQSRKVIIAYVQKLWFSLEINLISKNMTLPKSNPLLSLTPFLDGHGLLRVGGRLHNAPIDTESKYPLILPKKSPLTSLIINDAHLKTLHGGTQLTLNYIRTKYWIIGGRVTVRSHILKCVRCARYRGQRAQQLMGQLPLTRVSPSRPFTYTGLDYAGPVALKTWKGRAARTYKRYIAIFVCMTTSAVHIEIVTDYSTNSFIAAFKRFTGRRGICATVQSDCGTNFTGADAELRRLFDSSSKELKEHASLLANDGTTWIFNPPAAPHFGGKWEAAVKSVKFHLKRVLGEIILTYEEMSTILIQIEAVLNSRPLTPITEDASDLSVLTPSHFLVGDLISVVPEPDLSNESSSRLSRWQKLRQIVDLFWIRWSKECLQRYQAKAKWHHPSHTIKEGSLVLMVNERYPPGKWPLARVINVHLGTDGLNRVVTLKTASSTFKRPITKVCVLPMKPHEEYSTETLSKAGGMFVQQVI